METVRRDRKRALRKAPHLVALLACLFTTASLAETAVENFEGWEIERDVDPPSYAVIDPVSTNLNIDSVVLVCEEADDRRILQLQIYLSTEGPLLPKGVEPRLLKDEPRAEIAIDGRGFQVGLFFADDYAVLADEEDKMFPLLSKRLLDAMQTGRIMILRFDLVVERAGQPVTFDSEAVIDLQAGAGGAAIAAVRLCAGVTTNHSAGVASAKH